MKRIKHVLLLIFISKYRELRKKHLMLDRLYYLDYSYLNVLKSWGK